ncbi:MAG: PDDEXK nuclease domain-containing protein [Eubacteriales bacterium]|nr:PDDEXK nuclease domain-containing protein [Eubacteriales bacterium]
MLYSAFHGDIRGQFWISAQEITKDPYKFDFIILTKSYNEKELKNALMDNIQKFLLELGNGFAFVGREYRIEIGTTENFIDMLFYHIRLYCYVVVEVKVTELQRLSAFD